MRNRCFWGGQFQPIAMVNLNWNQVVNWTGFYVHYVMITIVVLYIIDDA